MISNTNLRMLELLSASLHDSTLPEIRHEDWPLIYAELRLQTVHIIPAPKLSAGNLCPADLTQYLLAVGRNLQIFYRNMETQDQLIKKFEAAGIPVVVVKGAAAAMLYSHPEYRCMGDIDILVQPDDFTRAYGLMCSSGYVADSDPSGCQRHILFMASSGVEIELHRRFSSSDNARQCRALDQSLFHAIPDRQLVDVCGYSVPVLPPLQNGLVLLSHINQHLRGGLGLRQILDWMCFVEHYLDDAYWEHTFRAAADQIGLKKLAIATTELCRRYLGLNKDIHWCILHQDNTLCQELLEYILAHGNFGKKDSLKATTVSVMRIFKHPIHGLKVAQQTGRVTWGLLKKHPRLRPFAWLYQLCRWVRHGSQSGIDLNYLVASSQAEQASTKLLRRLGVTRI